MIPNFFEKQQQNKTKQNKTITTKNKTKQSKTKQKQNNTAHLNKTAHLNMETQVRSKPINIRSPGFHNWLLQWFVGLILLLLARTLLHELLLPYNTYITNTAYLLACMVKAYFFLYYMKGNTQCTSPSGHVTGQADPLPTNYNASGEIIIMVIFHRHVLLMEAGYGCW